MMSNMKFMLLARIFLTSHVLAVVQVEIACPGFVRPSSNVALSYTGPAFEAAIDDCNQLYKGVFNFTLKFLVRPDVIRDFPSLGDNAVDLTAHWYYRERQNSSDGISAIVTPGGFPNSEIHQLIAAWNIVLIETSAYDKSKYTLPAPTIISTSYVASSTFAVTILNLLVKYRWTSVYTIADSLSAGMYVSIGENIGTMTASIPGLPFIVFTRVVTYKNLTTWSTFDTLLTEFQMVSRVLVFLGQADILRHFLIEASLRDMTNGDFVYICIEPYSSIPRYGNLTWQYGDIYDEVARQAFKSLLLVHPYDDTVQDITSSKIRMAEQFRQRAKQLYNVSYSAVDQPLPAILPGYSSVRMFAQVLNETLTYNGEAALADGRRLSYSFLNRIFRDGVSEMHIDRGGIRRVVLVVSQFVDEDRKRQAFLVQSAVDELKDMRNFSGTWAGNDWPPPNEPHCGFRHDKLSPECQQARDIGKTNAFTAGMAILCLGTALVVTMWIRKYHHTTNVVFADSVWWRLTIADMEQRTKTEHTWNNDLTAGSEESEEPRLPYQYAWLASYHEEALPSCVNNFYGEFHSDRHAVD